MTNHTTATFRKIAPGLYGTGIRRQNIGCLGWYRPVDEIIEVVIDRIGNQHWVVRELTDDGELTDNMGEAFYRLADAKQYVTDHADRI